MRKGRKEPGWRKNNAEIPRRYSFAMRRNALPQDDIRGGTDRTGRVIKLGRAALAWTAEGGCPYVGWASHAEAGGSTAEAWKVREANLNRKGHEDCAKSTKNTGLA